MAWLGLVNNLKPLSNHALKRLEIPPVEVDICVQEDDVWSVVVVGREDADETDKADLVFVKVDKVNDVWNKKLA